jgi:hypothetical protein
MLSAVVVLGGCRSSSSPQPGHAPDSVRKEPTEQGPSAVAKANSSVATTARVVEQAPSSSAIETGPTCDPCSFECLDKADKLRTKAPKAATKLASLGCDIDKCGYLSQLMVSRCRAYGLPASQPQDCDNQCIAECNSVDPGNWDACMSACEKKHGCPSD